MICESFLDFIYPVRCLLCGESLDFAKPLHLCRKCYINLPWISGVCCKVCGRDLAGKKKFTNICNLCTETSRNFESGISVFNFAFPVKDFLFKMKYKHDFGKKYFLSDFMIQKMKKISMFPPVDCLTYIPLHPLKAKERGFNQSQYLAKRIGKKMGLPVKCLLWKALEAKTQALLKLKDRKLNIKGLFKARFPDQLKFDHVLLVDDVMTSGNTLNECSRILKQNGVLKVTVFSLMSTPDEILC